MVNFTLILGNYTRAQMEMIIDKHLPTDRVMEAFHPGYGISLIKDKVKEKTARVIKIVLTDLQNNTKNLLTQVFREVITKADRARMDFVIIYGDRAEVLSFWEICRGGNVEKYFGLEYLSEEAKYFFKRDIAEFQNNYYVNEIEANNLTDKAGWELFFGMFEEYKKKIKENEREIPIDVNILDYAIRFYKKPMKREGDDKILP